MRKPDTAATPTKVMTCSCRGARPSRSPRPRDGSTTRSAAPSPAHSRRSSASPSKPPAPARSAPTRRGQGQQHCLPDHRVGSGDRHVAGSRLSAERRLHPTAPGRRLQPTGRKQLSNLKGKRHRAHAGGIASVPHGGATDAHKSDLCSAGHAALERLRSASLSTRIAGTAGNRITSASSTRGCRGRHRSRNHPDRERPDLGVVRL